jgi:hypothetical protein
MHGIMMMGFHRTNIPRNDLFATQTLLLLAFTLELMENELAAFSPYHVDRVRKNIIDRLIIRFESSEPIPG